MAATYKGSAIVCDAGPNTIAGPVDIVGVIADGEVTIAKGGSDVMALLLGVHHIQFRSAGDISVTGACTLLLRTSRHD